MSLQSLSKLAMRSLDVVYSMWSHNMRSKFFEKGWGSERVLDALFGANATRGSVFTGMDELADVPASVPAHERRAWARDEVHRLQHSLDIAWDNEWAVDGLTIRGGHFASPVVYRSMLPVNARTAHVQLVLPQQRAVRGLCIHLAATGDHLFDRRRKLAAPLVREGIAALILENPFYGARKPPTQVRHFVEDVSSFILMGLTCVHETMALARWAKRCGYQRVGISGMSMGAHMGALAASALPFSVAMAGFVAPPSAATVFLESVFSNSVCWSALDAQLPLHAPPPNAVAALGADGKPAVEPVEGDSDGGWRAPRTTMGKLRAIMDRTDIKHFSPPVHSDAMVVVMARDDAFVNEQWVESWRDLWGSNVRLVDGGHVSSMVWQQDEHRQAIRDAFERLG